MSIIYDRLKTLLDLRHMTNYVKDEFGDNYAVVKEQGITMYIDGSNAAWVNGGVVYKLNTTSGSLTNKQIKSIAVSM